MPNSLRNYGENPERPVLKNIDQIVVPYNDGHETDPDQNQQHTKERLTAWIQQLEADPMIKNLMTRMCVQACVMKGGNVLNMNMGDVDFRCITAEGPEDTTAYRVRFIFGYLLQIIRLRCGPHHAQRFFDEMKDLYQNSHYSYTLDAEPEDSFWDLEGWSQRVLGTDYRGFNWEKSNEIYARPGISLRDKRFAEREEMNLPDPWARPEPAVKGWRKIFEKLLG